MLSFQQDNAPAHTAKDPQNIENKSIRLMSRFEPYKDLLVSH